jgi:hypothetical protein
MNLKSMAAVAVASGVVTSVAAGDAVQWRVEDGGNGHWYSGVSRDSGWTWSVARKAAETVGGALVSCESDSEWQFVRSTFSPTQAASFWQVQSINALAKLGPWIGASQAPGSVEPNGGWTWLSGVPLDPQDNINCCGDDCSGVPEDRLHLYAQQSTGWTVALNDLTDDPSPCSDQIRSAIFEWSADCNNDGIVDYGQCRDGSLPDFNGNNIPDCCEQAAACVVGNHPIQWRVDDGGNGHWYVTTDQFGTWDAMNLFARARGGELASLGSIEENDFANRTRWQSDAQFGGGPWIGASKQSGQAWQWSDGTEWAFMNWAPGEPCCGDGGLFAHLYPSGQWNDHNQTQYACRGLIEWSADCNSDGIVDYGQILSGELADTNDNGVPDLCEQTPCPGDIATDGVVNGVDLAAVLNNWGTTGGALGADANGDGVVDGADLALVLNSWGPCPK